MNTAATATAAAAAAITITTTTTETTIVESTVATTPTITLLSANKSTTATSSASSSGYSAASSSSSSSSRTFWKKLLKKGTNNKLRLKGASRSRSFDSADSADNPPSTESSSEINDDDNSNSNSNNNNNNNSFSATSPNLASISPTRTSPLSDSLVPNSSLDDPAATSSASPRSCFGLKSLFELVTMSSVFVETNDTDYDHFGASSASSHGAFAGFKMKNNKNNNNNNKKKKKKIKIRSSKALPSPKKIKTKKIIMLSAGECGKSTLFKQIKIIFNDSYTTDECLMYRNIVYTNILWTMKAICTVVDSLHLNITDPKSRMTARYMVELDIDVNNSHQFTKNLGLSLLQLYNDPVIQQVLKMRSQFQLADNLDYYMANMNRIAAENYVPNLEDILHSRVKTTGMVESLFSWNNQRFIIWDVGGQRNERKKWIHAFPQVGAVLYVTPLSEYDQMCYEDDVTNRMHESLELFEDVVKSKWFTNVPLVLIFTKDDIFRNKIKETDLSCCFPDYTGGCDYQAAFSYIVKRFTDIYKKYREMPLYAFVVNGTDTENVRKLFYETKVHPVDVQFWMWSGKADEGVAYFMYIMR